VNRVVVKREEGECDVLYTKRDGSWHVKTPADDGFWPFATSSASDRTVAQLIRKKWCGTYNIEPDDFTNRD